MRLYHLVKQLCRKWKMLVCVVVVVWCRWWFDLKNAFHSNSSSSCGSSYSFSTFIRVSFKKLKLNFSSFFGKNVDCVIFNISSSIQPCRRRYPWRLTILPCFRLWSRWRQRGSHEKLLKLVVFWTWMMIVKLFVVQHSMLKKH